MKQHIIEELQACINAGELPASLDPHVAMRTLTVGVLGVAVLRLSERLTPGEDRRPARRRCPERDAGRSADRRPRCNRPAASTAPWAPPCLLPMLKRP